MGDLLNKESAKTIGIVGLDIDGKEETPVGSSPNREIFNMDTIRVSAVDGVIALTTTPILLKVGATELPSRKMIIMQGQSNNIKWGFSSTTQSFDLARNQFAVLPMGVSIWAKVSVGVGALGFGEGS